MGLPPFRQVPLSSSVRIARHGAARTAAIRDFDPAQVQIGSRAARLWLRRPTLPKSIGAAVEAHYRVSTVEMTLPRSVDRANERFGSSAEMLERLK
jgi:hypothetical protein